MLFRKLSLSFILICTSLTMMAQSKSAVHDHGDSCFHVELSMAHHYLEITHQLTDYQHQEIAWLRPANLDANTLFSEFFRLLSITQAMYPDHHLDEAFYDKAIEVANRLQNLGASAYLYTRKKEMLKKTFGDEWFLRECHCGKCVKTAHHHD